MPDVDSAKLSCKCLTPEHVAGGLTAWAEAALPTFEEIVSEFGVFACTCEPSVSGGSLACNCAKCDRWHAFCARGPFYEVPVAGHVIALARYLTARAHEEHPRTKSPLRVLEVGAGAGLLSLHLRAALATIQIGAVELLPATDNGARGLALPLHTATRSIAIPQEDVSRPIVLQLDYSEALATFHPHIAICSWMPLGCDWTPTFRRTSSLLEYILIGEPDTGVCGSPATWGSSSPGRRPRRAKRSQLKYELEGWRRVDLKQVSSAGQICRLDECWDLRQHSSTVSFKRVAPAVRLWPSKRYRALALPPFRDQRATFSSVAGPPAK